MILRKEDAACLRLARAAAQHGEVPIPAVIVRARWHHPRRRAEYVRERQLATRHAEMIAIEQAAEKVGSWRQLGRACVHVCNCRTMFALLRGNAAQQDRDTAWRKESSFWILCA